MTTETMTASEQFLGAWETAGRPQIERIKYPAHGGRPTSHQLSHGEVLDWARGEGSYLCDDGRWVELRWELRIGLAEGVSSSSKLIFCRD